MRIQEGSGITERYLMLLRRRSNTMMLTAAKRCRQLYFVLVPVAEMLTAKKVEQMAWANDTRTK